MTRELVYSPEAIDDLDTIFWFIASDNLRRATTYIAEIRQACHGLSDMPMMGTARPDLRPALRTLPLWRRLVVAYEVLPNQIHILRVFSAGQDYEALMGSKL